MSPEKDEALCKAFPKIFANRHGDMKTTAMCWGFECDDGWYDLIYNLCQCIQSYIDANPKHTDQLVATQVKEKFGTLRFYYDCTDSTGTISGMVWFAEHLSGVTCEVCGKPGTLKGKGWYKTVCSEHEDKSI